MNEIGEILKEARIEQGYTLDDLQQTTKIQKRYLQAIEDGNTDILPGRFYERAFIKQYADIVGLDGEKLLEENVDQTSKDASEEFAESVNVAPTRSTPTKSDSFLSDISEYIPTILIFLLVAAIFIMIYIAFRQTDGSDDESSMINQDNTEQVEEQPVTDETNDEAANNAANNTDQADSGADSENTDENQNEEEENTEEETEEEQEVAVTESTGTTATYEVTGTPPEEQTLTLTANGDSSWVSVSVAGGESNQATLADGESLDTTFGADTSSVEIRVGNAPSTDITLNDTTIEYAPEASSVVQNITIQFAE